MKNLFLGGGWGYRRRSGMRPSAGIGVVEVQKLEVLHFLICPRDPLRRSAWSRCKNSRFLAFLTFPDEPSAEIVRVEALSLWHRANSS